MEPKQTTIGEILDSEKEMVLHGSERFGEYFINASEINHLLNDFIKSVDPYLYFFAIFLSHIKKHHTLALFSAARLHRVQVGMNLRQVLEASSWAAYGIANTEKEKFYEEDGNNAMIVPEKLKKTKNKWLEKNFPDGSKVIKNYIQHIGGTMAHANLFYTLQNFKFNFEEGKFESPFFDYEDDFYVKTDLWWIANIGYGAMDLFYGVNQKLNTVIFADDFVPKLLSLKRKNDLLKLEMMQSPRFRPLSGYKNQKRD